MQFAGTLIPVLNEAEIHLIHAGALQILAQMGMEIQNDTLLTACRQTGFQVDFHQQRVRFPASTVEEFLSTCQRFDWSVAQPHITASAGIYHGSYHDPTTGNLLPWTEERLAGYIALAKHLPQVGSASMLGCQIPVPAPLEPLYERFYNWKYGGEPGGSIFSEEICPYLLELYQVYAQSTGKTLEDIFHAAVYLVPPLKLGMHEAAQVVWFWRKGLHVSIGDMYAMGANAPVTLAGAVTLNLAERIALSMLNYALWREKRFHLGVSIAPIDMRTLIFPFGRPETALANLITAQLARYYGVSYSGHAALTSAKLPGAEAGFQKALTGIPTLLSGGSLWMDAGLLSIDEVFSPIQMVLDNEFLSALRHFTQTFNVNHETIGLEAILTAGPGGSFLELEHTADHFRKELWQPSIWTRTMLGPWLEDGSRLDVDLAREKVMEVHQKGIQTILPDTLEKDLLKVIEKAKQKLIRQV